MKHFFILYLIIMSAIASSFTIGESREHSDFEGCSHAYIGTDRSKNSLEDRCGHLGRRYYAWNKEKYSSVQVKVVETVRGNRHYEDGYETVQSYIIPAGGKKQVGCSDNSIGNGSGYNSYRIVSCKVLD